MRRCRVLVRKVERVGWPPSVVKHRGEPVTLGAIFAAAGIRLDLVRIESPMPMTGSGRPFEPADLRAAIGPTLALDPEPATEGTWTAVVLIVPVILDRLGGRSRHPLGIMFGRSEGGREACALAHAALWGEPRSYLRTLAHELGHVFNLVHPGDPGEPFDGDAINTLMVPTDRLHPPSRFPESIEFRFAPRQRDWLATGPEPYVQPAGSSYGSRPPDWPFLAVAPR